MGELVTRQRGQLASSPYSGEGSAIDWSLPTTDLAIPNCPVWQDSSVLEDPSESGGGSPPRAEVITVTKAILPPNTDITKADHFVTRGQVFTVIGEPEVWRSPWTEWDAGTVVTGRRIDG